MRIIILFLIIIISKEEIELNNKIEIDDIEVKDGIKV